MKITRRQLRRIIIESLNEGKFEPSVEGWLGNSLYTGTLGLGGALAGGTGGVALGAALGGPAAPISGTALGIGGAFVGGAAGGAKGHKLANEKGYRVGDIPDDHPLHANNLQNSFDNGEVGSSPEEIKEYIQSFVPKGFTGDLFSVIYRNEDFSEGDLKSTLTSLGYVTDAGKLADDIVLAKSRATKAAKEKAGEVAKTGYEASKGFFGRTKDSLMSFFGGEDDEDEETAIASNEEDDEFPARDMFGDPIDQKKT